VRVLLDCDGVLADYVGAILKGINAQLGTSFQHSDVTGWNIAESLGIKPELVNALSKAPGFVKDLEPIPGAQEGVRALSRSNIVYVVTRPGDAMDWTRSREATEHKYGMALLWDRPWNQTDWSSDTTTDINTADNVGTIVVPSLISRTGSWKRIGNYTRVKSWEGIEALIERTEDPYMSP
jgi:ketosteroid isomerase-like protein